MNTFGSCGNGSWGNWIINLIIIIIAVEFLTQIFCGCGNNYQNNPCGTSLC